MTCRRICRELLWLARFGELGPSSQPHLDHLVGCQSCRDEVGFDREMVRQLRVALAARVDGLQPSSTAWEGILRRAQAPEPSRFAAWWRRSMGLVGRLRTATAMAGTGLALVLALQMEVMPASAPASAPDSAGSGTQADAMPASERGNRAILQVTPAQPHPEAVIALPLARTDLQPAGPRIPDAPPGELVTLELTFRSPTAPAAEVAADDVSEAESGPQPSPVDPGLAS